MYAQFPIVQFLCCFFFRGRNSSETKLADGDLHKHSPFVNSTSGTILAAAKLLSVNSADIVCDLGCGDGAVLNTILDNYRGVKALGLDIDPELIALARSRALEMGVAERATYETADFFNCDPNSIISRITKVYMYIVTRQLDDPRMKALILAIARAGVPIVSYVFKIAYLEEVAVDEKMQVCGCDTLISSWVFVECFVTYLNYFECS
jgi:SAM-dependent methyltransferase